MKQHFHAFALIFLVLIFGFQSVEACSLSISPLRKEFRGAKLVFLGKIVKMENYYVPIKQEKLFIPEHWQENFTEDKSKSIFTKVTFEIKKVWKGDLPKRKEFVSVAYWGCGCPGDIDKFNEGEEYVIFTSEKNFVTVCDSFRQMIEEKPKLIKRLNDFSFRTWARIYPF